MVLFVLSSIFVVAGCLFLLACLAMPRLDLWLVSLAMLWYLQIVITGRALSLAGLLGTRFAWVAVDALFAAASFWWWRRRGRPSLRPPATRHTITAVFGAGWLQPTLVALTAIALGITILALVASIAIPQNLDDVLTAYLARVGYWIQHGDLGAFRASPYNSVQVSYPANAQLPVLRSIVLSGGDRFVGLEQWYAAPLGAIAIYGLARTFGAERSSSWFCGVIWMLVPTVCVQTGIALTDLVSVDLVLATLLFGVVGWRDRRHRLLAAASITFGLFLGTKQIATFVAPGFALLLLYALVSGGKARRREWLGWMVLSVPVVAVLGLVDYVKNWRFYGHPLGDPDSFELFAVDATTSQRIRAMSFNLRRTLVDSWFGDLPARAASRTLGLDRMRTYDPYVGTGRYLGWGQAWAGFFVSTIVAIGLVLTAYQILRYRRWAPLIGLIPAATFVAAFYWTRTNYTGAFSRYLLVPLALALASTAVGLSGLRVGWNVGRVVLALATLGLGVGAGGQAVHAMLRNGQRPLYGADAVWSADRLDLVERSTGFSGRTRLAAALRYTDCVAAEADVGLMIPDKFPQSLLFGADYRRRVVQYVEPFPVRFDADLLRQEHLSAILTPTASLGPDAVAADVVAMEFGVTTVIALDPPSECTR